MKYAGGRIHPTLQHGLPKGLRELTTVSLGTVVDMWEVYSAAVCWTGTVVHIVEPGEQPKPHELEVLFRVSRAASALRQPATPTRPSKYRRLIVQKPNGRVGVFPLNQGAYRALPGQLKDER